MKNCNECKYAVWKRTAAGKLHPSGEGHCTYKWEPRPLPVAFYFIGKKHPEPCGGQINRKRAHAEHCPYWAKADAKN